MMKSVSDLEARLGALREQTNETPLFNPAFQLSLELSREIEAGELKLDMVEAMIAELECDALQSRARRLRRLVEPVGIDANLSDLCRMTSQRMTRTSHATAPGGNGRSCTASSPPTRPSCFPLPRPRQSSLPHLRKRISTTPPASQRSDRPDDHARFRTRARARGDRQRRRRARPAGLRPAGPRRASSWPEEWHDLKPMPFRFASWVGYDMDGRTDIKWYDSIGFRLAEKAVRLERYVASLEAIDADHRLLAELRAATAYAQERADDFAGDLTDPERLSAAANRLTADDPAKLLSLTPLIDALEEEAAPPKPPAPSSSRRLPPRCAPTGWARAGSTSASTPASFTTRSAA